MDLQRRYGKNDVLFPKSMVQSSVSRRKGIRYELVVLSLSLSLQNELYLCDLILTINIATLPPFSKNKD
jgi:hypothetical protein